MKKMNFIQLLLLLLIIYQRGATSYTFCLTICLLYFVFNNNIDNVSMNERNSLTVPVQK